MIIDQIELRRKRAGSEGAECAVVRVRVLGQRAGVWIGGGGSFLVTLPTAVSTVAEIMVGTRLAGDFEDGLPCREHQVLMHGMARNCLVSEMLPTMAYRPSPYSPEKDDQL